MRLEVELFVDGLCGWNSDSSTETSTTIEINLLWGRSDTDISRPFDGITGWDITDEGYSLERATSKQMRFIAYVDLPAPLSGDDLKRGDPVYIKGTRLTRMRSGGYRDRVYISAIRTKLYSPENSTVYELVEAKNLNAKLSNKLCRIGIKLKVNKNTEGALDRFNIVASMTARTWDGVQWSGRVKTSNPAAVALEVLTGLIHELSAYNDNEIDLYSFGKLYEFCENQEINIYGDPAIFNLESNGVMTTASKKVDVLRAVLSVCEAGLYVNEFGKIIVYPDAPQSTPIALLNPQRIVKMNESRNLNRKADGYKVDFIDQDADWNQDTKEILRPRVEEDLLNTFTSIKFDLTTTYKQAMWKARRLMAKEIHRPGEVTVSVGKEGRLYRPGSLIKVQHEGFKIGLGSGEIVELITEGDYVTGFRLMERFDIAGDRDYYIDYYVVDETRNHVVTKQIHNGLGYTDKLMLTVPILKDSYDIPTMGNILSTLYGEPGQSRVWESKRYLVTGLNPTQQGYDLTLVQYNDEIYNTTSIDMILPYTSSILSKAPGVYDSYGRKPIDGEPGQGMIDPPSLAHVIPPIVSQKTPRYRGAASVADTANTGVISTNQGSSLEMNRGDWVAYLGNQIGIWTPFYCYRWNGEQWSAISTSESEPYMAALSDITQGAPLGVFSTILTQKIMALQVVADRIETQLITLRNNGVIKSEGFTGIDNPTPGFQIKAYDQPTAGGLIEANNIKTRNMVAVDINATSGSFTGTINATSGTFNNATINNALINNATINDAIIESAAINGTIKIESGVYIINDVDSALIIANHITGTQLKTRLDAYFNEYIMTPGVSFRCSGTLMTNEDNGNAYITFNIFAATYNTNGWLLRGAGTYSTPGGSTQITSLTISNYNYYTGAMVLF